jgi:hypothetical protein
LRQTIFVAGRSAVDASASLTSPPRSERTTHRVAAGLVAAGRELGRDRHVARDDGDVGRLAARRSRSRRAAAIASSAPPASGQPKPPRPPAGVRPPRQRRAPHALARRRRQRPAPRAQRARRRQHDGVFGAAAGAGREVRLQLEALRLVA